MIKERQLGMVKEKSRIKVSVDRYIFLCTYGRADGLYGL